MDDNRVSPYPLRLNPKLREKLQGKANKNGIPLSEQIINTLDADSRLPSTNENIETKLDELAKRLSKLEDRQKEIHALLTKILSLQT